MKISMIAAIQEDNAIGKKGDMLWHIPIDLKFFQQTTMGKPIIMGRGTFDSLKRKPLKGRRNIVLSKDPSFKSDEVEIANNLIEALSLLTNEDEVFIIGGGKLYAEGVKIADKLYITHIPKKIEGADTFFPNFSDKNDWEWRYGLKKFDYTNNMLLNFSIYYRK